MSRTLLDDLKARQIAFLEARLVSDASAREWRERLPDGVQALLAMPLGKVADAEALNRAVAALLADEGLRQAIRPVAAKGVARVVAEVRAEKRRAGELVPASARETIDRLLERPKLIPERLLRELLDNDAVDHVMRDVLYDTLKEFSDKVNPFFAEWGLPALLKRIAPLGFGAISKGMGSMKSEFERRLEPEIRKFLQGFSRTAMRDMLGNLIAREDTPEFIALRKHVVGWLLEQEIGELARQLDEEGAALAQAIGLDVADFVVHQPWVAARARAEVDAFFAQHRYEPLCAILGQLGLVMAPDVDALAAVTWPLVRSLCESAPVRAWIASIVSEFFDGLPDDLG